MKKFELMKILIWSFALLVHSAPRKRKSDTIRTLHRTGEAIVVDFIIQKYEREHKKFYEENKHGDFLDWPVLYTKNLSNYCRKYLNHSVPGRTTDSATGTRTGKTLYYKKLNISTSSKIDTLHCRVMNKRFPVVFHLTRAPEHNCAYALKSTGRGADFILNIINKHCDFENKLIKSLKRQRVELVYKMHHSTGQPIGKDNYLLEYELEHREFVKQEGHDKFIDWPYVREHPDLNYYCFLYMKESARKRNREGVKGNWKTEILHYQLLNKNEHVKVITVKCTPSIGSTMNYHMTRSPTTNCVYALLRKGFHALNYLVIIFKHCDFEEQNNQQIIPQNYGVRDEKVTQGPEMKKENFGELETLQIFPNN